MTTANDNEFFTAISTVSSIPGGGEPVPSPAAFAASAAAAAASSAVKPIECRALVRLCAQDGYRKKKVDHELKEGEAGEIAVRGGERLSIPSK